MSNRNRKAAWKSAVVRSFLTFIALATVAFVDVRLVDARTVYRITDLGTLGGASSAAEAISPAGHVAGWSTTADGERHGFLFEEGAMLDLGTLVGGTHSRAMGVNRHGQVAGDGGLNGFGPMFREFPNAFLWQDGILQGLGALHNPSSFNERHGTSLAGDINNLAQIVGWSKSIRGLDHAYVWENGVMRDISTDPADFSVSRAFGINSSGQVVGEFSPDARLPEHLRGPRAVFWQDGVMQDLGILPGHSSSVALDINEDAQVVGWSGAADASVSRAVLWSDGTMHDLGTLPGDESSRALAINGAGQVVGWSKSRDRSDSRAVLWQSREVLNLNDLLLPCSGWVLTEASDINEAGQIVGTGLYDGQVRAYLLEPALSRDAVDEYGFRGTPGLP